MREWIAWQGRNSFARVLKLYTTWREWERLVVRICFNRYAHLDYGVGSKNLTLHQFIRNYFMILLTEYLPVANSSRSVQVCPLVRTAVKYCCIGKAFTILRHLHITNLTNFNIEINHNNNNNNNNNKIMVLRRLRVG